MMSFWERFFREQEVQQVVRSSGTLEKNIDVLSQALKEARLKIPVRLDAEETSIKLTRSFAPFRPGSASIFCGSVIQQNDSVTLKGKIRIAPFFRIYFQLFLSFVVAVSLALIAGAVWEWGSAMFREDRNDLVMLEVAGAGVGALVVLVGVAKILVALNYISNRGQREKIISAFHAVER